LALKNKKILGAGLDVFNADEILFEGRQDIIEFARLSNVVATPHIAFNTHETKERLGGELMKNIDAILDGNPINIIN
jgi:phosphoglycerate dehydrogenase-like enzyme